MGTIAELQRAFRASDDVVCAELDDEVVLLNTATGIYFGLDAIGAAIWGQLAAGRDVAAIHAALLAEYDVEPEQLRADIAVFLSHLADKGLITAGSG